MRQAGYAFPVSLALALGIFLCMLPMTCEAGEQYHHLSDFAVPKEFYTDPDFFPVGYLNTYPVPDVNVVLTQGELDRLRKLFIEASSATESKYRQNYPLDTSTPIYKLLKVQYPQISKLESDRGQVIFLGKIAKFLQ